MKTPEKKFSELLFSKRMQLDLTQKEMAPLLGIKVRMYIDYEKGKYDNNEGDARRKKILQKLASLKPADSTENFNKSLTQSVDKSQQLHHEYIGYSAEEKDARIAYLEMALQATEEKYQIALELAQVRKQRIEDLEEKLKPKTLSPKSKHKKEEVSESIKKDGH